jgi:hypothetical protein
MNSFRMAFDAEHRSIFGMMVGQDPWLRASGIVCGLAAALALTGVMRTMLVASSRRIPRRSPRWRSVPDHRRLRVRRPGAADGADGSEMALRND